jgi:cysteine-rich repeat protein
MCAAEASCGDGFLWEGVEGCDDGNGEDVDGCNNDCAAPRWVFISSTNGPNNNADLGGVAGADAHCQELADAAGLGGMYMAWLTGSDPGMAPATRFASTGFAGWYMLPMEPPTAVARGWEDLTQPNEDNPDDYLQAAILADESGNILNEAFVWTNTDANGFQNGPDHCVDWMSDGGDVAGNAGRAKGELIDGDWTVFFSNLCANGGRLYCFQVM